MIRRYSLGLSHLQERVHRDTNHPDPGPGYIFQRLAPLLLTTARYLYMLHMHAVQSTLLHLLYTLRKHYVNLFHARCRRICFKHVLPLSPFRRGTHDTPQLVVLSNVLSVLSNVLTLFQCWRGTRACMYRHTIPTHVLELPPWAKQRALTPICSHKCSTCSQRDLKQHSPHIQLVPCHVTSACHHVTTKGSHMHGQGALTRHDKEFPIVTTGVPHMLQQGVLTCHDKGSSHVTTRGPHMLRQGVLTCSYKGTSSVTTRGPHM